MRYGAGSSSLAGLVTLLAGSLLAAVSPAGAAIAPEAGQVVISPMVVSRFGQTGQPLTTAQCYTYRWSTGRPAIPW